MDNVEIQHQRMNRILEISRELTATVSLESLLQKIVQAAAELTGSEVASILLFDEQTEQLRFIAAKALASQLADIPVPVDGSIAGLAFTSGEPQIVSNVRTDPRYYKQVEQQIGFEAHSLLAAPLQFKDRRIGVIEVANKQDNGIEFHQEDLETLTALAAQATIAIENARLVETLQEARDLAQALRQASTALSSILSYDVVLRRILEQVSYVMPDAAANIMLIEGPEVVRVFRGHGYEQLQVTETPTPINFNVSDVAAMRNMQETGQPVVIPYVERDEEWVYSRPEHVWIKSYAGAPIRIQNQVIGFLNVNSATPGFFSQREGEYLQAFANHAAIAIENARLYGQLQQELAERMRAEHELRRHRDHLEELVEERTAELVNAVEQREREITERARAEDALQRRNQELATLNAVSQALSTSFELQDILDQALLRTVNTLGFTGGLIALADEQMENMVLSTHMGLPQTFIDHLQTHSARGTLCDFLYREGKPQYIEDLYKNASIDTPLALSNAGMRSYAVTPIIYQDRTLGSLCLFDTEPHSISETDRVLLTAIGQQIGVAVENARLFRDTVRERQVSHTLLDTAKALSTTLRLDKLLERAMDELQRVVPYDAALISMVRDDRCWTVASRGAEQIALRGFTLEERPLVQRVVRECGPVIVPDVQQEPDWSPVVGLGSVRSWLGVPLTAKGDVIGVLMMNSHQPFTYDKEAARPAFAFAHQVVLALENSRLYEQVQAKLREANLLHSVTTALSYTLDLDQILPYVARSLCEVLNVTSIKIYNLDQEADQSLPSANTTIIADYVAFDGTREERRLSLGQTHALTDIPAAVDTLTQRRPIQVRVDDLQVAPHLQTQLKNYRVKALLLLPMVIGDRVLGFAQVWESHTPRHFTEGEISMGQTLVHQATITIDNARLVEVLRQRTTELQSRNEELDAFAHTVAHDLKNPLNSLIGFARFLEKRFTEMSDQEMRDDLQMIAQSGKKLDTIINELLILASVRQMEKVKMEPLDMSSIVTDAQKRMSTMIAEHQAEIVVMDDWPVVLGRGQWVEEVWVNYVSNALKYGGRPPRVELGAAEQEDNTVRFWVRDNGPGLTPEDQSQLFVPFTRLDQARAKGHGLGLSIVRRIVEKMGGQVGVESHVGKGSTFVFILPMTPCE
ncbi:MAG: GAF domain-containing protein [Chloroflexi bacterium]|nr:GAF domain-containing protein [Chloroflexota bacterium]